MRGIIDRFFKELDITAGHHGGRRRRSHQAHGGGRLRVLDFAASLWAGAGAGSGLRVPGTGWSGNRRWRCHERISASLTVAVAGLIEAVFAEGGANSGKACGDRR